MNQVILTGKVKRDSEAVDVRDGCRIIDFALEVDDGTGRYDIFDCRTTSQCAAMDVLGSEVFAGEELTVKGRLMRRTWTDKARVAGSYVEVRNTYVLVYVEDVLEGEDVD